ncbi:MAG: radical SAM protein [Elusimicrobia bacterium]|nr:radical SAM protein [Elusimicrobiota bacterium]
MKTILRKTLLYKSGVEYADFCINHVEGCAHGCVFPCYAMVMKMRCGIIKNYKEWLQPKIVANALELLDKEIPKYKHKIKFVHLCFSTDPFMYKYPEVADLTLNIIERLNKDNIRCVVLTKGIYPKVLVNTQKYGKDNEYGITFVSLDEKFKRRFEPYSASYKDRIKSLKYLHDKGLRTWVSVEPYPTPNLIKQDLKKILGEISFVDKIIFGKLNYNVKSTQFDSNGDFYHDCAETVIEFCRENNIEVHIKYGTQKKDIRKTEKIFIKKTIENLNLINITQPALLL